MRQKILTDITEENFTEIKDDSRRNVIQEGTPCIYMPLKKLNPRVRNKFLLSQQLVRQTCNLRYKSVKYAKVTF